MPSRPNRAWTVAPLSGLPLSPCSTRGGSRMPYTPHRPFHKVAGLRTALGLMHLPAEDLAAVQVDDQVQEVELTADRSR